MNRIHIYCITVFTSSEEDGTLKQIFSCNIALHDPASLERISRGIMVTQEGDEVSCARIADAILFD